MGDYQQFLESKQLAVPNRGIDVAKDTLHPSLFEFQRDLVVWSLRKGRAALFADAGLGKSFMQLEWARQVADRVLILAPLAVAQQTVQEGERWGIPATYARSQAEAPATGITITNYEMVQHFDPDQFGAVVLDECFIAGTPVDTPTGPRSIEMIRAGDRVLNAAGVDRVVGTKRREARRVVVVHSKDHHSIICSENHPFLTPAGWVRAVDLRRGNHLVGRRAALRAVRGGYFGEGCSGAILRSVLLREMANGAAGGEGESRREGEATEAHPAVRMVWCGHHDRTRANIQAVLQPVMLGEMAHAATGDHRQSPFPGGGGQARGESIRVARVERPEGFGRNGAHSDAQPDGSSRSAGQGVGKASGDRTSAVKARWQWQRADRAATDALGIARQRLVHGACHLARAATAWIPNCLQSGHRQPGVDGSGRGRRPEPLLPQGRGREAGCQADGTWVDRVEILESGHPEFRRISGGRDSISLYDLQVARHPSFSIHGVLVHNSSILKAHDGKTRSRLIELFQSTPYRLCCTATPAPNDIAELANHAEFLGIMSRVEMLATFFVHDDHGWRLKGHARDAFYRWLASWGMSVKRPSDLGYPNDGYDLPDLSIAATILPVDYTPPGQLFFTVLKGVADRGAVRHATIDARVTAAANLINADRTEPWLAWVGLNDEGRKLAALVPDAVLVEGSDSVEAKTAALTGFAAGRHRVLISKVSIFGFGMNFQHCARMVFVGMGDSYESYYQAIRRCWRFGQTRPVEAHIVLTEPERGILDNVRRKEREADAMSRELVGHVAAFERAELAHSSSRDAYEPTIPMQLPTWLEECAA